MLNLGKNEVAEVKISNFSKKGGLVKACELTIACHACEIRVAQMEPLKRRSSGPHIPIPHF